MRKKFWTALTDSQQVVASSQPIRLALSAILLAVAAFPPTVVRAQEASLDAETPLERYVRLGIERNLALQQRRFDVAMDRQQVREAKGGYLPSLNLDARDTRADGG